MSKFVYLTDVQRATLRGALYGSYATGWDRGLENAGISLSTQYRWWNSNDEVPCRISVENYNKLAKAFGWEDKQPDLPIQQSTQDMLKELIKDQPLDVAIARVQLCKVNFVDKRQFENAAICRDLQKELEKKQQEELDKKREEELNEYPKMLGAPLKLTRIGDTYVLNKSCPFAPSRCGTWCPMFESFQDSPEEIQVRLHCIGPTAVGMGVQGPVNDEC